MKKLLILITLLPIMAFAQQVIQGGSKMPMSMPAMFLRDYEEVNEVPGVNIEKLLPVLQKWFSSKFDTVTMVNKDSCHFVGYGTFQGSYTYHGDEYQSSANVAPVNYSVGFKATMTVMDGKYRIFISNLKMKLIDVTAGGEAIVGPGTGFAASRQRPFETNLEALYRSVNEDVSLNEHALGKTAAKCISKAKKQGLL